MKKLMIANVGNRNLVYTGNNPLVNLKGVDAPFKTSTQYLLDNFEQESPFLEPQIFPELIEHLQPELEQIVLFVSDTPEGERDNQDTLYAGQILKKILEKKYPGTSVLVETIRCRVVDVNALMQLYRNSLNRLLEIYSDYHFVLCDTAGTSQQKTSLKIVAEYLLSDKYFSVFNVAYAGGKSNPEAVASIEYRRVIDSQQIEILIKQYAYAGALSVYFGRRKRHTDNIAALLQLGIALFSNHAEEAVRQATSVPRELKQIDFIQKIASKDFFEFANKHWQSDLDTDAIFKLCLILEIAHAYQEVEDWGFSLLHYHIFEERLLHEILKQYVTPHDLVKNWKEIKEEIISGDLFPGVTTLGGRNIEDIFGPSMPVLRDLARCIPESKAQEVLGRISDANQTQFSQWRNKFAHEGRTISLKDIKSFFPIYKDWRATFIDENAKSLFHALNELIVQELRK